MTIEKLVRNNFMVSELCAPSIGRDTEHFIDYFQYPKTNMLGCFALMRISLSNTNMNYIQRKTNLHIVQNTEHGILNYIEMLSQTTWELHLKRLENVENVRNGSFTQVAVLCLGHLLEKFRTLDIVVLVSVADEIH